MVSTHTNRYAVNSTLYVRWRVPIVERVPYVDSKKWAEKSKSTYYLPWNDTMDVDREFRVFVAPKSRGISAISQYGWSRPFPLKDGEKHQTVAFVVSLEAIRLFRGIHPFAGEALLEQGFTFDIRLTENVACVLGEGYKGNPCQLVELNTFG